MGGRREGVEGGVRGRVVVIDLVLRSCVGVRLGHGARWRLRGWGGKD